MSLLRTHLTSQALYDATPHVVQAVLANLEAWRRDRFRRYGNYRAQLAHYDPRWYATDLPRQAAYQVEQINALAQAARRDVPHYRGTLPDIVVHDLADLARLPVLEKETIRQDPLAFVKEGVPTRNLWSVCTSGSTGTPLRYYHDRTATRAHQAVVDAFMAMHGCVLGEPRVRFSGACVAPYEQRKPPFWVYIHRYRQLQCSAYHLEPGTYCSYVDAMRRVGARYGTGYATAWHLLATYILESSDRPPTLKAIFTDSEGVSLEQQRTVERAFGCPVFQTYGAGEVGQVAQQCGEGRYHVLTRSCIAEVVDDRDEPVPPGGTGQVIVTDLTGFVTPFIRYRTGDLATVAAGDCTCGWRSPSWTAIDGRLDDEVVTPEGRRIGRLSHVLKPGVGIRESQIVQTAPDRIEIRVVPDPAFDPASMDDVLAAARRYMGEAMQMSWTTAERLPRTKSGKLRHVVRECP